MHGSGLLSLEHQLFNAAILVPLSQQPQQNMGSNVAGNETPAVYFEFIFLKETTARNETEKPLTFCAVM